METSTLRLIEASRPCFHSFHSSTYTAKFKKSSSQIFVDCKSGEHRTDAKQQACSKQQEDTGSPRSASRSKDDKEWAESCAKSVVQGFNFPSCYMQEWVLFAVTVPWPAHPNENWLEQMELTGLSLFPECEDVLRSGVEISGCVRPNHAKGGKDWRDSFLLLIN